MNKNKAVFYIEIKNEIILYARKITATIVELTEEDILLSSKVTQDSLEYYANQAYIKLCHIEKAAMLGVLDMSADYESIEPIEIINLADRLTEQIGNIESISDDRFTRNVRTCVGSAQYRECENVGMPFILATVMVHMKEYQKLFFSIIDNENTYLTKVFRE